MKVTHLLKILCASILILGSTSINATLIDRGNGLIYSTDLDITYMQDAYAFGSMNRSSAQSFVDNLAYGGYNDWRLPSLSNVDPGVDITDYFANRYLTIVPTDHNSFSGIFAGELGHIIYSEGLDYVKTPNAGQFGTIGIFDNVYGGGYWTSEDYLWTGQPYEDPEGTAETVEKPFPRTPKTGFGWLVYFGGDKGERKTLLKTNNSRGVWAVHNGDIGASAVPLPAAAWLFGTGVIGLLGFARRKK